jgi:hypothetical protein
MKIHTLTFPVILSLLILLPHRSLSQHLANAVPDSLTGKIGSAEKLFRVARVEQDTVYHLDQARAVKQMDAMPDGSLWYVVDEFAHWQYITIDGQPFPTRYHDISATGTRISPKGDHLIWTGLMHATTRRDLDSTTAYLYQDTSLLFQQVSDYPELEFSRSGDHWAGTLPSAYTGQTGDRDLIIVDGHVVHKNEPLPHRFSFSHDERHWAYRSTKGLLENLVTDRTDSAVLLYRWPFPSDSSTYDATIWRYTPDVNWNHKRLEGRDYDFDFKHVARVNRTAYSSLSGDTSRTYVNFNGHNQGLYRWAAQFLMDDSGQHLAYFACDPAITHKGGDERRAVVVYDGSVYAGPFPGVILLFMSPSGKHIAYSTSLESKKLYLDKKVLAKTSAVVDAAWSPDESKLAFVAAGEHGKYFVVAEGKRSPLFEQIGHIGWSADGKYVLFTGVSNGRVIKVKQSLEGKD